MMPTNKNIIEPTSAASIPATTTTGGSTSVYINPKFRNAHINPNFLPKKPLQSLAPPPPSPSLPNQIYINPKFKNAHINPMFLQKNTVALTNNSVTQQEKHTPTVTPLSELTSIVTKTNRKIVRQSVPTVMQKSPSKIIQQQTIVSAVPVPLIKLGKRKLVRVSQLNSTSIAKLPPLATSVKKPIHTLYKIVKGDMPKNLYKIDRRLVRSISKNRTPIKSVHRKSSGGLNETLSTQKVIITNRKLLRMYEFQLSF